MELYNKFKEIGFSENETKTYVALLEHGDANLKSLEKLTLLHRANLLGALARLGEKGAVGISFHGKRRQYSPAKPEALLGRFVERAKETQKGLLDGLAQLQRTTDLPQISVFHGKEAVKGLLDDELEQGQTINVMQSSKNIDLLAGQYLWITREKRWRMGMKMRIIYSKTDADHARKVASVPRTEARISSIDMGPVTIDVYGERVALVFGDEPKVVRIASREVAHAMLGLFETIWRQSKKAAKF